MRTNSAESLKKTWQKAKLKQALLHYHLDKQNVETHGLKWIVLSEQITKLSTKHFNNYKSM